MGNDGSGPAGFTLGCPCKNECCFKISICLPKMLKQVYASVKNFKIKYSRQGLYFILRIIFLLIVKKKLRGVITQNSSTNIIFYGLLIKKKTTLNFEWPYTDL